MSGSEGDWQHNRDRDSLQCQHIIRDQIRWHDEAGAALIVTLQWQVVIQLLMQYKAFLRLVDWFNTDLLLVNEYSSCSLIGWCNIILLSYWLVQDNNDLWLVDRYQALVTPISSAGVMDMSRVMQSVRITRPSYRQHALATVTAVLVTVIIVGLVLSVYRQVSWESELVCRVNW